MIKRIFIFVAIFITIISFRINSQTVISVTDELVLPQYAVNGGTSTSRIMYVCGLRLTGLSSNTTYRYTTGASTNSGLTTTLAAGNHIGINNTSNSAGYIVGYTAGKSSYQNLLDGNSWNTSGSSNNYSEFTTDASGNYTGWFSFVPTGNTVFTAGNNVYIYVQLNNGAGGTSVAQSYRTTSTVTMLAYGTTTGSATQCTAIYGSSYATNENFIFLFNNTSGTGRPIAVTWAENDGLAQDWTTWYTVYVSTSIGYWGTIIPNSLANGIRRVERRDITNTILNYNTDDDGIWPSGTNTINPSGGTTPLALIDAPLPVTLEYFNYSVRGNSINLVWKTSLEINNKGFEILRYKYFGWEKVGYVEGKGNSNEFTLYNFTEGNLYPGKYRYRLKQSDFNGNYEYFDLNGIVEIKAPTEFSLMQNYPNPFNPSTNIKYQIAENCFVTLKIYDMLGKEILTLVSENQKPGEYNITFDMNSTKISSGIYFYRLAAGNFADIKRMIYIK